MKKELKKLIEKYRTKDDYFDLVDGFIPLEDFISQQIEQSQKNILITIKGNNIIILQEDAKGQSNIESLWDNVHLRKGPTGFLLVAKCDVIANALHVPINSPIILFTNPK